MNFGRLLRMPLALIFGIVPGSLETFAVRDQSGVAPIRIWLLRWIGGVHIGVGMWQ